jgi:hypothetical protein
LKQKLQARLYDPAMSNFCTPCVLQSYTVEPLRETQEGDDKGDRKMKGFWGKKDVSHQVIHLIKVQNKQLPCHDIFIKFYLFIVIITLQLALSIFIQLILVNRTLKLQLNHKLFKKIK